MTDVNKFLQEKMKDKMESDITKWVNQQDGPSMDAYLGWARDIGMGTDILIDYLLEKKMLAEREEGRKRAEQKRRLIKQLQQKENEYRITTASQGRI